MNERLLAATVEAINTTVAPTSSPVDLYAQETNGSHVFRLILYGIIFMFTLFGNMAVIFTVIRTKELRTVTGYLIANLAVADLSVGVVCIPFTILYFELGHWPFGHAMCKLIPGTQAMSVMASIGTLFAISVDRFRSIAYPYKARITLRQSKFIILAVWLFALLVGLPILIVMDTRSTNDSKTLCNEYGWPSETAKDAYTAISFCITYAIPLPVIAVFYSLIVLKLHRISKKTSDKEGFRTARAKGRVVKMLIVVVTFYLFCFLPYHVVFLWSDFGDGRLYRYFYVLLSYCQVLVYTNSAINPVLYAFLSTQFRAGFTKLLPRCLRKKSRTLKSHREVRSLLNNRTSMSYYKNAKTQKPSTFHESTV